MADGISLTCKMGTFIFDKGVRISQAKRIRDEVMGQFFNPKPEQPHIRTEKDAEVYMRNHDRFPTLSAIPFDLMINVL